MGLSARETALEALERCRRDSAWSGPVMDGLLRKNPMDKRDAALAGRLFLGVLQNRRCCDYYIGLYCSRRPEQLQPKLLDILRIGAYQLLFLDKIPPRAAVNESVALCRSAGFDRASGLVNAILRRIAENRERLPEIPGKGSAGYLAIRYSHPEWFVQRLIDEHGYAFAEHFLSADNEPAGLAIQVNTLKVTAEDYEYALRRDRVAYEKPPGLSDSFILAGGAVTELPGYEEGHFYVQDAAARMAVLAAAPAPGMRVLDACAAPGGKSFAAAVAMDNRGSILSCDIHEKKLALLRAGAQRLGITCVDTRVRDARAFDPVLRDAFDLVIADVPCSGLGVIRRRPEIRYKPESELAGLPAVQRAILNNLAHFVRPGGVLLYSTCTVLRAENQAVVEDFLLSQPAFAPEDFTVGDRRSSGGMYSFWPHVDGTDGFFAAKLRKKQLA